MRTKFVKRLKGQEGFTLIELLAVLSILALVLGIISTTIIFGFRSYNQISVENELRDEADVVMSSVITELYAFAPDRIAVYNDDKGISGIELLRTTAPPGEALRKAIVISDEQLQIRTLEVVPDSSAPSSEEAIKDSYQSTRVKATLTAGSSIGLDCEGLNACETGLVNIKLVLNQDAGGRNTSVELESRFGF